MAGNRKKEGDYPVGTFDKDLYNERLLPKEPEPEDPNDVEGFWGVRNPDRYPDPGPVEVARMKPDELVQFVFNYMGNLIFTSADLTEHDDLGMVFMPAVLGAFKNWDEASIRKVGILWEYYDKALPRSINGKPCFASMYVMHIDDWKKARTQIQKEVARRNALRKSMEEDL